MTSFGNLIKESDLPETPLINASFTYSSLQELLVSQTMDGSLFLDEW